MRIAIFTDTYPPEINGVATSSFNLANVLKRHGHEVLVVTTNVYNNKMMYEDGVIRIPGPELKWLYGYRRANIYNSEAMKIIEKFHPDVCHSQTDVGVGIFGILVAMKFHIGVVYTFHTMIEDYAYYVTKGHFDRFARHVVRAFFRGKSSICAEYIAPSAKIKDYLRSIGIDITVTVMPTGIELDRFIPTKESEAETKLFRKKFGIEEDEYVILSLGRIAKEKSIDVLLKGYAQYLKSAPKKKTKFVITGLGPAEGELKELAVNLGIQDKVIFTGPCKPDETQKYYHLGDCFVSASLTETQGLTIIEAMAAELVVLARYDDNLAGFVNDGDNGYLFFDESDFADKLKNVIEIDAPTRKRIIDAANKSIHMYSMEEFYHNAIEVYQRVYKKTW